MGWPTASSGTARALQWALGDRSQCLRKRLTDPPRGTERNKSTSARCSSARAPSPLGERNRRTSSNFSTPYKYGGEGVKGGVKGDGWRELETMLQRYAWPTVGCNYGLPHARDLSSKNGPISALFCQRVALEGIRIITHIHIHMGNGDGVGT